MENFLKQLLKDETKVPKKDKEDNNKSGPSKVGPHSSPKHKGQQGPQGQGQGSSVTGSGSGSSNGPSGSGNLSSSTAVGNQSVHSHPLFIEKEKELYNANEKIKILEAFKITSSEEIKELKHKLEENEIRISSLQEANKIMAQDNQGTKELTSLASSLKEKNSELENKVSLLTEQNLSIHQLKNSIESKDQEIAASNSLNQEIKEKLKKVEAEIQRIKFDEQAKKGEEKEKNAKLKEQLAVAKQEIVSLTSDKSRLQKQVQGLSEDLANAETEKNNLTAKITQAASAFEIVKKQSMELDLTLQQDRITLTNTKNELELEKQKTSEALASAENFKNEAKNSAEALRQVQVRLEVLSRERDISNHQNVQNANDSGEGGAAANISNAELAQTQARVHALTEEVCSLRVQLETAKIGKDSSDADLATTQKQLKTLTEEKQTVTEALENEKKAMALLQAQVAQAADKVNEMLASAESTQARLTAKVNSLTSDLANLKTVSDSTSQELVQTQTQLSQTKSELRDINTELLRESSAHNSTREELRASRALLENFKLESEQALRNAENETKKVENELAQAKNTITQMQNESRTARLEFEEKAHTWDIAREALQSTCSALESRLSSTLGELLTRTNELSEKTSDWMGVLGQLTTAQATVQDLDIRLKTSERRASQLREDLDTANRNYTETVASMTSTINSLKSDLERVNLKLSNETARANEAEKNLESAKEEIAHLEDSKLKLHTDLRKKREALRVYHDHIKTVAARKEKEKAQTAGSNSNSSEHGVMDGLGKKLTRILSFDHKDKQTNVDTFNVNMFAKPSGTLSQSSSVDSLASYRQASSLSLSLSKNENSLNSNPLQTATDDIAQLSNTLSDDDLSEEIAVALENRLEKLEEEKINLIKCLKEAQRELEQERYLMSRIGNGATAGSKSVGASGLSTKGFLTSIRKQSVDSLQNLLDETISANREADQKLKQQAIEIARLQSVINASKLNH